MSRTLRDPWVVSRELIAGDTCHHNKQVTMKLMRKNGNLATNDK